MGTDYNCFGWVFADGRFWIRPNAVPAILRDNGYQPVREPLPGDVIIYWEAGDWPTHCGLVRAGANEGGIQVESKWGHGARFVHAPEDQTYSTSFTFFRSPREGHLLEGLEVR